LTVILGVTQNLKDQFSTHLVIQDNLSMVERNAQQLLKFINQLLDLSKLDNEKVKVNWELGDVVLYLQYLSESFHSYAKSKQIQLTYYPETKSLTMDYDHEKIQQVISNLLSNAIKFTPNKGKIFFHVNEIISNEEVSKRHLQIKIFNSGQGIAAEHLPHLFDRFYQIDSSHTRKNEGTGIGLALTKELVELMQGQISVKSELGKGTEFIVNFPVRKLAQPNPDFTQIEPVINTEINTIPILNTDNSKAEDIPLLLLIEDNPDVAAYIQSCLSEQYKVLWAENGQLGIDKALEIIPDVIISDVMMPEKNGFEVTQFLKNDERTSHIPIILLTAKADIDSKIAGLERGADAYLSKPFDKNELLIRLRKLVALRQHLQSYYGGGKTFSIDKVSIAPTEKTIQKDILIENEFLKKINKVIEKHLSDSDFEIPNLCRNLHMSQSQLYRKLKALTGKTIVAYLRSYRLHKAKEWLQNSDSTVSSIAYDVGFTDPAYFSRMFSEEFGRPPSESRK
jgi:DNA-binding response OmpR family regulator/two-component sensor histidine kinase